jgi:outer membrane protein TolC
LRLFGRGLISNREANTLSMPASTQKLSRAFALVTCLAPFAQAQPAQTQTATQTGAQPPAVLNLSLDEAIQRGLKNNLSVLERESSDRMVRADRLRALSALLPSVNGYVGENVQTLNLATFGFHLPGVPEIIGPFGYSSAHAQGSVNLFDQHARKNWQAAAKNLQASELSLQDARDLVVQAVANTYLTIIADAASVVSTRSEVATAQALYERARDQHAAGVSPAIDELRSQVEMKSRQQQLLSAQNRFAKDKLTLQQAIGLPGSQAIELTDTAPFAPLENLTPEQLNERAKASRADYQSLKVQLESAQLSRQAAVGERYPVLALNANYGYDGVAPSQARESWQVTGQLKVSVFDGGRIRADIMQSDATIQQRKDEMADLERRMDTDIRSALLDLQSAADQVSVAQDSLQLADQTLTQARDRFTAGVTDNIEVVQAQDSVAGAQDSLISALYAHNLAKVALARAIGMTETNLKQFIGGK